MITLKWFLSKSPADAGSAQIIPAPRGRPDIAPPILNRPDPPEIEEPSQGTPEDLEAVFCMIDYRSANGDETRRRITMQRIASGPNAPILTAICHERRAIRHFRCDRIECFITEDGEVIEPQEFFLQILGINLADFQPANDSPRTTARDIRDHLRAPLSLLVTTARADGDYHAEELDIICQYIETELRCDTAMQRFPTVTVETLNQLTEMVRHMRPRQSSIPGYLEKVVEMPPKRALRFRRALQQLILADGKVTPEEMEMFEIFEHARNTNPKDLE